MPAVGAGTSAAEPPQESRCADCHFSRPEAPARNHLFEWDISPHGREAVGCDACHGGDAGTFDPLRAHRDILGPTNPASRIHRGNLPSTCGACHPGPFVAFQRSVHFRLLEEEGDELVPVCTTCHGTVGAYLLSPRSLEAECAACHAAEAAVPRPEYPAQARAALEQIETVRELLDDARDLIDRVEDDEERATREEEWRQAEVPLEEATESGHEFRFDQLEDRLDVARRRVEELLERLMVGTPR